MMTRPRLRDLGFRRAMDLFFKLLTLMAVVGLPFWWFMVELAEHGWK